MSSVLPHPFFSSLTCELVSVTGLSHKTMLTFQRKGVIITVAEQTWAKLKENKTEKCQATNQPTIWITTQILHWPIWVKTMSFIIHIVFSLIMKDFQKLILSNKGHIFKNFYYLILNTKCRIQTLIKVVLTKFQFSPTVRRERCFKFVLEAHVSTVRIQCSKGQLLLCTWKL